MAVRNRLHINHIPQLQEWLVNDGWKVEQPKGIWEKVRARKGKRVALFYESNSGEHLSYEDKRLTIQSYWRGKGCLTLK